MYQVPCVRAHEELRNSKLLWVGAHTTRYHQYLVHFTHPIPSVRASCVCKIINPGGIPNSLQVGGGGNKKYSHPKMCGRRSSNLWYLPSPSAAKPAYARFAPPHASRRSGSSDLLTGALSRSTFLQLSLLSHNFSLIESASSSPCECSFDKA